MARKEGKMIDQETTETYEEALEVGYFGTKVDPLPNEVYQVGGPPPPKMVYTDKRPGLVPEDEAPRPKD